MIKTIKKPSFREVVGITTMNLDDVELEFNAEKVGPSNFTGLRNSDYGKGFRMSTFPELIPLIYGSLENQEYATAKKIVQTLKNYWITGNTGILYTKDGMFVQDNPSIENGRISMSQKELEGKLGSHEEKGVVFSNDRTIRFTPYGFKKESQSALDLSNNAGIIALVNGEENAEKLAQASQHYKQNPYFWTLTNVDSPQNRVPYLYSYDFDHRLLVYADFHVSSGYWYSFGVRGSGEATREKNQ